MEITDLAPDLLFPRLVAEATGFVSLNSLAKKVSRSAGANWSAAMVGGFQPG